MGVTLVLSYPIPENKSSQQVIESLYKLMDILNAKRCGIYKIDCDTFTSASHIQPPRMLQTFHDSGRPSTTFALMDNGNHYLLADSTNFDLIVQTYFNQIYPCRKSLRVECTGVKFELSEADFLIRIGQVLQDNSGALRGIVIEIEYAPCLSPSSCWDIISQVAQYFLPPNQIPPPPSCTTFEPIDTIRQYQHTFNSMRRQT